MSRTTLALLAFGSLASLAIVDNLPVAEWHVWHADMLAAAQTASRGMDVIRQERLARGHHFDPGFDPAQSGLVGDAESVSTSVAGNLTSKQTSINPNFAAAVVEMLKRAGVESDDCVAVGCSGSFPALNLSVCAALETLQCRPLIIASAAGSQYGANRPDLLWIDMEGLLNESGVINCRSSAASLGGYEDQALGMTPEGRQLLRQSIRRNGLTFIEATSFEQSLNSRMQIYEQLAQGAPIKAYINVGGGTVSVGRTLGKQRYDPGLNLTPPLGATQIDSVMTRFMKAGVPVIHLVEITQLAAAYGLPIAPTHVPAPGDAPFIVRYHRNRPLAALVIGIILVSVHYFVLRGIGGSLRMRWSSLRKGSPHGSETEPAPHLELMA